MGFFDSIPVFSQVKSLVQVIGGDEKGARETQKNFAENGIVASQVTSAVYSIQGNNAEARRIQEKFGKSASGIAEGIPIVGHGIAAGHAIAGNKAEAERIALVSTKSSVTALAGAAGGVCGPGAPACAAAFAVGASNGWDAAESEIRGEKVGSIRGWDNLVKGKATVGEGFDLIGGTVLEGATAAIGARAVKPKIKSGALKPKIKIKPGALKPRIKSRAVRRRSPVKRGQGSSRRSGVKRGSSHRSPAKRGRGSSQRSPVQQKVKSQICKRSVTMDENLIYETNLNNIPNNLMHRLPGSVSNITLDENMAPASLVDSALSFIFILKLMSIGHIKSKIYYEEMCSGLYPQLKIEECSIMLHNALAKFAVGPDISMEDFDVTSKQDKTLLLADLLGGLQFEIKSVSKSTIIGHFPEVAACKIAGLKNALCTQLMNQFKDGLTEMDEFVNQAGSKRRVKRCTQRSMAYKTGRYILKAPGKIVKLIKRNPFEASLILTSLGTCMSADIIANWDNCNEECDGYLVQRNQAIDEIDNIMNNINSSYVAISNQINIGNEIVLHDQHIAFYFKKLQQEMADGLINMTQTEEVALFAENQYNNSIKDNKAKEAYIQTLEDGIKDLSKALITDKDREIMDWTFAGISIASGVIVNRLRSYANNYIEKVYASLSRTGGFVKVDGLNNFYKHVSYDKATMKAEKMRKLSNGAQKFMKGMTIGIEATMTAVCSYSIHQKKETIEETTSEAKKQMQWMKNKKTQLRTNELEIREAYRNVSVTTSNIINRITIVYSAILEAGAKTVCIFNDNTPVCNNFRKNKEKCSITATSNAEISQDLSLISMIMETTFTILRDQMTKNENIASTKIKSKNMVEKMKDMEASFACILLEAAFKDSYENVCDEIYESGLYLNLEPWLDWENEGECSSECIQRQTRKCTNNQCIGSRTRNIKCENICIPAKTNNNNKAFIGIIDKYCKTKNANNDGGLSLPK